MVDLSVELTDVRDYTVPQRDGTFLTQKRVTFYIGKFGPFHEYFPVDAFNELAFRQRADALKQQLEAIHR